MALPVHVDDLYATQMMKPKSELGREGDYVPLNAKSRSAYSSFTVASATATKSQIHRSVEPLDSPSLHLVLTNSYSVRSKVPDT